MLVIENLTFSQRLDNINVYAESGQFVHLLGPNGAGKSSLLQIVSGLGIPDTGRVIFDNGDIAQLTMIELARFRCFQEQQQSHIFAITVRESLSFFAHNMVMPAMLENALEIEPFMTRSLLTLSGGESRRVQIARALMQIWPTIEQGQALILLDEPSQGLDFRHQHLLLSCLVELTKLGNIVLMSHHDLNISTQYADRVWLMRSGMLEHFGEVKDVMTPAILSDIFDCQVREFSNSEGNSILQTYLR
ncbi:ABC transporter ATP-binding protein [uncultured Paraglaciecola sp.]|uniref:ABC transporter ATP-binding protein n=1 Tax=uncultured Paraglaciecola sp. TaxID=1765024 RepID=UPI0030D7E328|tara:strand:- start:6116 stop:6856 length:741 start_codon:yes stop_codon:yes gene_type:complete